MKDNIKIKNYCEMFIETTDDVVLFFLENLKLKKDKEEKELTIDNLYEFCETNCNICIDSVDDLNYVVELDNLINFDKMFNIAGERITLKVKNLKTNKKGVSDDNYMASVIIKKPRENEDEYILTGIYKHFIIDFSELQFIRFYTHVAEFIKRNKIPESFMNTGEIKKVYKIKMDEFKKIYYNKRLLNVHQRAFLRIIKILEKFIIFLGKIKK